MESEELISEYLHFICKGKSITLSIPPTPLHITTVPTLYRAVSSD